MVIVDITAQNDSSKIRIFNCYRPPGLSNRDCDSLDYIRTMCKCIDDSIRNISKYVICGDFNFPSINWSHYNLLRSNDDSCSGIFLDFCYNNSLHQFNSRPTRLNNIVSILL